MRGITQIAMEFLADLAGYGDHGLIVADMNDLPKEIRALWNRQLVYIYGCPDFKPLGNGKITITNLGRQALESIEALPLFNKASQPTNLVKGDQQ